MNQYVRITIEKGACCMGRINGVEHYAAGVVKVPVYFPNGDVSCRWCPLFLRHEEAFKRYSCRLTGEWILDPLHGIGGKCPLEFKEGCDNNG